MPQAKAQGRRSSGSSKQSTSRARTSKSSSGSKNGQRKATPRARSGSSSAAKTRASSSSAAKTRASRNGSGSSVPKKAAARVQDATGNVPGPKAALVAAATAVTAAAGVAGTLVATRSRRQRKVLGVPVGRRGGFSVRDLMPSNGGLKTDVRKVAGKVNGVAQQADRLGRGVSRVATTVQNISDGAGKGAKE